MLTVPTRKTMLTVPTRKTMLTVPTRKTMLTVPDGIADRLNRADTEEAPRVRRLPVRVIRVGYTRVARLDWRGVFALSRHDLHEADAPRAAHKLTNTDSVLV
ncbi:hypothetical protein, partial [Streptomyces sp. ok210]|uniref:hypothetical protein n=1 Tax=Streptomyces sp. ok210 TaxID=1761905 RepID=UPI0008E1706C